MLVPSIHQRKPWLISILIIVIGLNLYFNFSYKVDLERRVRWLDHIFFQLTSPIQYGISWVQSVSVGAVENIYELGQVRRQNEVLRTQLKEMQLELHQFKELQLENERLRELLNFKESQPLSYLAAAIVGHDPDSFFHSLILDRGSQDGIEENMPVVSAQGAVGRIIEVGRWTSKVLLITDINSRLDAVIQRSRTRVIVAGASEETLRLQYLPRRQDVREGDLLVTSGMGGYFPPGFEVGTVLEVSRDPHQVLEEARVEPSVNSKQLEEVLIIKGPNAQQG